MHAHAAHANVRATLHVQRWRPNGKTDREPNWYKHSMGQSAQVMGVGVRIARNYGGAAAASAKRECAARTVRSVASSMEQTKKLRNLRQTFCGSMRR
jgi:hypothetical protein